MKPYLLDHVESLGHAVFTSGKYNLNIIGIRNKNGKVNKFDDRICVVYKNYKGWVTRTWKCTTDPGRYWLNKPINIRGTAILVPGQYRGVYKIDKHAGRYDALCQRNGKVKTFRDSNKDSIIDMDYDSVTEGRYGINIHKAGSSSTQVDRWSAGCTVFANSSDFDNFLSICKKQISVRGWRTFTYTLIEV